MSSSRLLSILLAVALPLASPAMPQSVPQAGSGIVHGIVTRAGATEPLPSASVTLQGGAIDPQVMQAILSTAAAQGLVVTPQAGASTSEVIRAFANAAAARGLPVSIANLQTQFASVSGKTPPAATTDRDGRFIFKDVAPGHYTVRVQLDGYFGKPELGDYPSTGAIDVVVAARETREANLSLIRGVLLGGRVFDKNGQLMSNANVEAFGVTYELGFPVLTPLISKPTDDRGEYRLFWVPPGEYYIAATPRQPPASPGMPAAVPPIKTFYPGFNSIAEARQVAIRGGEDIHGLDIGLREPRSFSISGQVSSLIPTPQSTTGAPGVSAAVLMLLNRDTEIPDDVGARQIATVPLLPGTGQFAVSNILPGSYDLLARVSDPSARLAGGQPFGWGRVQLEVRDTNVDSLAITVNPVVPVTGVVTAAAGATIPPAARVQLMATGGSAKLPVFQAVSGRAAPIGQDGGFSVAAVPEGNFRLAAIAGLTPDLFVSDVRQNAMSVFDSGFEVSSRNRAPLEIVVSAGAGMVTGVVRDAAARIVAGATVGLVPELKRRDNKALYLAAVSDSEGRFTIRGAAPGEYKIFAWESVPVLAYQNASFLRRYEDRGKNVRVGQGGTAIAELTVIAAAGK